MSRYDNTMLVAESYLIDISYLYFNILQYKNDETNIPNHRGGIANSTTLVALRCKLSH